MRACAITDERLFDFIDGVGETLDEHVADCDECQAFLAELWDGELEHDLEEPVLRQIRLEEFVKAAVATMAGIAGRMGSAVLTYGLEMEARQVGERNGG